jgi:hypothetical protein
MTLLVRPGFQFDTDASTYIEAVEAADTQALETATRYAINNFVIGCKQDGIWSAIKASCILAGARTLTGALVPLAGTAPTNVGPFASGDYNRKTGLIGDGSTKYLDSNRNNNADSQNSKHLSLFISTAVSLGNYPAYIGIGGGNTGASLIAADRVSNGVFVRSNSSTAYGVGDSTRTSFMGVSRASSGSFQFRTTNSTTEYSQASQTPFNGNIRVFSESGNISNARLAFYSVGESLSLAALDGRVSALITAFGAAIP